GALAGSGGWTRAGSCVAGRDRGAPVDRLPLSRRGGRAALRGAALRAGRPPAPLSEDSTHLGPLGDPPRLGAQGEELLEAVGVVEWPDRGQVQPVLEDDVLRYALGVLQRDRARECGQRVLL